MITEEPEMEDVVSEPDETAKEEAEKLAKEEEARAKVAQICSIKYDAKNTVIHVVNDRIGG